MNCWICNKNIDIRIKSLEYLEWRWSDNNALEKGHKSCILKFLKDKNFSNIIEESEMYNRFSYLLLQEKIKTCLNL